MAISFAKLQVLNPSRVARRLLWHVLSIGMVSRDEPEEHAGMDKAGMFLFRVKSGHGSLELAEARYPLAQGPTWWLLDLAQPRRYVPSPGSRLVTVSVRFSGPALDAWRDELFRGRGGLVLDLKRHSQLFSGAVEKLNRLAVGPSQEAEWRMHEVITSMLGLLLRAEKTMEGKQPPLHSPAQQVIDAVHANPLRDWRANELSEIVGISYSGLRKHFQETQGETLHQFLQRTRVDAARSRLTDMRLSVKEIALQLNFSSEFYFSRWFHKTTGMSPSRFRAMLRG
jgi:AraC-like DNA-binding protein